MNYENQSLEKEKKSSIIPFVLIIFILSYLLIFFRMKGIEQDYAFNSLSKKLEKQLSVKKEILATKAHLLSASNLRKWSIKFGLKAPEKEQIILVP